MLENAIREHGADKVIETAIANIRKLTEVTMPVAECIELQKCMISMLYIRKIIEDKAGKKAEDVISQIANIIALETGPLVVKEPDQGTQGTPGTPEADGTPGTPGTPTEEGKE